MNIIFNYVIEATIFGSVVGIIIFILKSTILRKLAAKWQYLLWSVMIVKLIFPKGPESKISVFNKINVAEKISETDLISVAYRPQTITEPVQIQNTFEIGDIVPYIWLAGFIVAILWTVLSFAVLKYKIRTSSSAASENTLKIFEHCKKTTRIHKNIKVVVQNHVPSTALCGIIRPKILITKDFENSDISHIEYTFIHELSHYKRGDIVVNYLLLILRCIHWFNSVIWFLFGKIRRDTELATDEHTMLYLNPSEHKSYGMALINTLSLQPVKSPKLLGMANNKHDITKRIKAIAKFKKPGFIQHISGILTVVLIASICLTSAAVAKPITDIIYTGIPIVKIDGIETDSKYEFGKGTTNKPKPVETQPENITEQKPEPIIEETKNHNLSELENFENRSIDTLISRTGQVIDNGNGTTDLNQYGKIVYYNTDYEGTYTFTVKPNSLGYIQFFVENEGYDHSVYIGISNVETKGRGWDYCFSTEGKVPIYLDGYNPDEEYFVTVNCYCPGHYNINGRILIY